MFRRTKLKFLNTKDDRIKIINDRINSTEKHLIEMCLTFANCTRKLAKHRDSYDELFKSLKNYADDEEINESFCDGMKKFCNAVTILADYMDLSIHRMEIKIVNQLTQFDSLCKTTRDNLRTAVIARDKEVLKQKQMLEIKTKFSGNNEHKLSDLKTILEDFLLISMKYHTKSLEALTASYYDISNIDEEADLMDFKNLLKSKTEAQERKPNKSSSSLRSQSMENLDSDQLLSPLKRKRRLSKSTKNLSDNKTDEEGGDEEDDEDEDSSDSTKWDDDSVSDAEDVDEAVAVDNGSDSKVVKNPLKQNRNVFVTGRLSGSTAAGIPCLVTSNREGNKPHASRSDNDDAREAHAASGGSCRRLVTVVESKNKSTYKENTAENVIDCIRNFRN